MKILYLGNEVCRITSGYDSLNSRNLKLLKDCADVFVEVVEFEKCNLYDKLSLYIGGSSRKYITKIRKMLAREEYDMLFFCSSMLGPVMKEIRKSYPHIVMVCNFHNIERHYAFEYLKVGGIKHLPFYLAACKAEKMAVKSMDHAIVLTSKDKLLMKEIYNKDADIVLPVCYEDVGDMIGYKQENMGNRLELLFVGTAFFANIEGLRWFIAQVLPHVNATLTVVGRGMEKVENLSSEKVIVKGFVPDLSAEYRSADIVVAPILSGGGMKTKIAEALMYGKTVVGTSVALEGYIKDGKATILADDSSQFIRILTDASAFPKKFNEFSRDIFLKEYSLEAVRDKFLNALNSWVR